LLYEFIKYLPNRIIGVGESSDTKCTMNFGTHNGIFHCDEVVGIAILEIAYMNVDSYVVRTRNINELNSLNVVIDIGGGRFDQLVSFPKEWAGGNEKTLPEISGIQDATFCHNGCFFARSKTKESILEMCRVAMN
jgi:uncharacterized UPF0160 family protein